ncbi:MAG: phosphatidylserine decarboxylase [Planctomycetota bacterium]|jgi:phosphatidylserine decarboxylase
MLIAKEGLREIFLSTLLLGALSTGAYLLWPPLVLPFVVIWLWIISFFRDPPRRPVCQPGDLCSPADGTVTEISELDHYEPLGGPAIRIGIFLSLFNVHINRAACAGRVRSLDYQPGEFLDARHPESGRRNEQNAVLIDPDTPMPGPVEIRQIAGLVARRIICHAQVNDRLGTGERFGLIKFGSRTELVIPNVDGTRVAVAIGDKVRAGVTILAHQDLAETTATNSPDRAVQAEKV